MKVRMLQQMSGFRADGSRWPGPGDTLEVSDQEGMALCRTTDSNQYPIAVPVEDKKEKPAENRPAPDDPKNETRSEPKNDTPADPPADPPPPKRGPGRPRKDSLPQ